MTTIRHLKEPAPLPWAHEPTPPWGGFHGCLLCRRWGVNFGVLNTTLCRRCLRRFGGLKYLAPELKELVNGLGPLNSQIASVCSSLDENRRKCSWFRRRERAARLTASITGTSPQVEEHLERAKRMERTLLEECFPQAPNADAADRLPDPTPLEESIQRERDLVAALGELCERRRSQMDELIAWIEAQLPDEALDACRMSEAPLDWQAKRTWSPAIAEHLDLVRSLYSAPDESLPGVPPGRGPRW